MLVKKKTEGKSFSIAAKVKNTLLLSGERIMFVFVELEKGSEIPVHSHPNEQMGICLRGSAKFVTENKTIRIKRGEAYLLAGNEKHGVTDVGKGGAVFLDTFSPPRDDFLTKTSQ